MESNSDVNGDQMEPENSTHNGGPIEPENSTSNGDQAEPERSQQSQNEFKQDILEFAVNQVLVPYAREKNLEFDMDVYRSIEEEKEKLEQEWKNNFEGGVENFDLHARISELLDQRWNYFQPLLRAILLEPPVDLWRNAQENHQTDELIGLHEFVFRSG